MNSRKFHFQDSSEFKCRTGFENRLFQSTMHGPLTVMAAGIDLFFNCVQLPEAKLSVGAQAIFLFLIAGNNAHH